MVQLKIKTTANSTLAIGGVSFSADGLVVKESAVIRISFFAEKHAHCQCVNLYNKLQE